MPQRHLTTAGLRDVMAGVGLSLRLVGLFLLCSVLPLGCRGQSTPERVCTSFVRAVSEGDAGAVYDNLLETTQWGLHGVQSNHRRMRALIESSYPEHERAAALSRLYGAEADSGRDLFSRLYAERYAAEWSARLGLSGDKAAAASPLNVSASPGRAGEFLCRRGSGRPFRLARSASGRFGVADISDEWEQAQLGAIHDLDTVERNANLYRRVSAPPAK